MSGGRSSYYQRILAHDLFGYEMYVDYGEYGRDQSKKARKINPMRDREVSELVWDVLCLIHSLDWAESGDTDMNDYNDDLLAFKKKWLQRVTSDVIEAYKEDLRGFANELIKELEVYSNDKSRSD